MQKRLYAKQSILLVLFFWSTAFQNWDIKCVAGARGYVRYNICTKATRHYVIMTEERKKCVFFFFSRGGSSCRTQQVCASCLSQAIIVPDALTAERSHTIIIYIKFYVCRHTHALDLSMSNNLKTWDERVRIQKKYNDL